MKKFSLFLLFILHSVILNRDKKGENFMSKVYLFMKFDVADFAKWQVVYDNHLFARQQFKLKDLYVLRNIENQNNVTILRT